MENLKSCSLFILWLQRDISYYLLLFFTTCETWTNCTSFSFALVIIEKLIFHSNKIKIYMHGIESENGPTVKSISQDDSERSPNTGLDSLHPVQRLHHIAAAECKVSLKNAFSIDDGESLYVILFSNITFGIWSYWAESRSTENLYSRSFLRGFIKKFTKSRRLGFETYSNHLQETLRLGISKSTLFKDLVVPALTQTDEEILL